MTLDEELISKVTEIIRAVRLHGDSALINFTREFDGVELKSLKVPREEIEKSRANVSEEMLEIIREAARNVRAFHEKQKQVSISLLNWSQLSIRPSCSDGASSEL